MATPTPTDIIAPISPTRFAAALKDLSIASLHLKVLEIRNALVHLAHSNAQLQPYADGTETALNLPPGEPDPDCVDAIRENELVIVRMRERIDLVKVEVVARGVSWREFEEDGEEGAAAAVEEEEEEEEEARSAPRTNGVLPHAAQPRAQGRGATLEASSTTGGNNPWTDGTFQVGTVRNGELHMDPAPAAAAASSSSSSSSQRNSARVANINSNSNSNTAAAAILAPLAQPGAAGGGGGRLTDEELRRLLEVRLAENEGAGEEEEDDDDEGLHL